MPSSSKIWEASKWHSSSLEREDKVDSEVLLSVSHRLSVSVIAEASDTVDMREIDVALDNKISLNWIDESLSLRRAGGRGSPDNTLLRSDLI